MIREKTTDTLKLDKKNYLKFRFWNLALVLAAFILKL